MPKIFTLYELCLNKTVTLLMRNFWNLRCAERNNPFSALPSSIIEELIADIARTVLFQEIKSTDLHLLLTSGRVRNFKLEDVTVYPETLARMLEGLYYHCKNLVSIKLKNIRLTKSKTNKETWALERLLSVASKLESVESCIEFNLGALCHCNNLRKLVLNFPAQNHLFDFLEVDGQMVPFYSLRVLEVYEDVGHPISYLDVAVILRYCTGLVEINCDVSKSLEYLHLETLYNNTLSTTYDLQKCCLGSIYLDDKDTTVSREGVYLASLTCPNLREVHVLVKDYKAIHALSDFSHLTCLFIQWETVLQGGDYHQAIFPLLENTKFGHNLKTLHLKKFCEVDFSSIGDTCPNLEELRVEFLSEHNRSAFSPDSFQKLITLHLENTNKSGCVAYSLVGLLSNAINLKHLTILTAQRLSDSVLAQIFENNKLSKVKRLHLSNCNLTVEGLQNLATNLTGLEYFEMSSSAVNLYNAGTVMREINPHIRLGY